MAWYKSTEWQAGLEALDEWYHACEALVMHDEQPERDLAGLATKVCDFCWDVAKFDPMPLVDLTAALDLYGSNIKRVEFYFARVKVPFNRLWRMGVTDEKPTGNPKEAPPLFDATKFSKPSTLQAFAKRFDINEKTFRGWIRDGKIEIFKHSRQRISVRLDQLPEKETGGNGK